MTSDSLGSFERDAEKLVAALGECVGPPEAAQARAAVASQLFGTPISVPMIGRFVVLDRLGAGGMGVVYAAFDPHLDRRVAIKVLLGATANPWRRERLVAEAKAMAKLAHPNVVHVYEIGEHAGQVFIAMECVTGVTLRHWCAAGRPSEAVLRVCVEAGRGLAAAHSAGIVHGDFKPDNVIVGDDGRPRVLDFGLAQVGVSGDTDPEAGLAAGTWQRLGTPRYMAPEQLRDNPPDALSDQYAYCLTVWECLTGALPSASGRGAQPHVAPRAGLPTRVERLLRRGLSDAHDGPHRGRFTSVTVLVDELARLLRGRRAHVRTGLGLGFGLGALAFAATEHDGAVRVDPCDQAAAALETAYPRATRQDDLDGVAARGGAYGAVASSRLTGILDSFAASWVAAERSTCLLEVHGAADPEERRRRSVCLQGSLSALASYRRVVARAGPDDGPRLVLAAEALPDPGRCAYPYGAVGAEFSSPELVDALADAEILYAAGELDEAAGVASDALALARRSGSEVELAHALRIDAHVKLDAGQSIAGARELFEATRLALRSGDHALAVETWGSGAWAIARGGGGGDGAPEFEGREWMTALAASTDSTSAVAFFDRLGAIDLAENHPDRAAESFERALQLASVADHHPGDRAHALQGLALATSDPATRDQRFAEAVAAGTVAFGAEHPRTLETRLMWAANAVDARDALDLLAPICADYAHFHPSRRAAVADCSRGLVIIADVVGDPALALDANQRWVETEDDETQVARGMLALHRGDARGAVTLLEPEVAADEASIGPETPFYSLLRRGWTGLSLGAALRMLGDPRADAVLARGAELIDRGASGRTLPAIVRYREYARSVLDRR